MAIIHNTTMSPTKLELLTAWLPGQPWYLGRDPDLAKVGGFRLDDPRGEVGLEFMLVTDRATTYQVPLTYRDRPLTDTDPIGTSEHGVLGLRWIYEGTRDPVLVARLAALLQGKAEPQAQSISNTADPTVIVQPVTTEPLTVLGSSVTANGPSGTDVRVETDRGQLLIRINRILQPAGGARQPGVSAPWRLPDGTQARGLLATAQYRA